MGTKVHNSVTDVNRKKLLTLFFLSFLSFALHAQTCNPTASYTLADGTESEEASGVSAPLVARFRANPEDVGDYSARYEWRIYEPGQEQQPLVHRFEEDLDYTFNHSGTYLVQLYATFVLGKDTIAYPEEGEAQPFQVSISESKLEMPNAFSPNGDSYNEIYKAKSTHQSIVSFKATIFNRWGQKLYSWNDVNGGWDGTYHGKRVPDGVYFVNVTARGADGHEYHIRKDVNVLTAKPLEGSNGGGESNE